MKRKLVLLAMSIVAGVVLSGCVAGRSPANTSNGLNGLQQRALTVRNMGSEFGATYDDIWYGVIATLQVNGFILQQADKESGYIYGVWQNMYEAQNESSRGGFSMFNISSSPTVYAGAYAGINTVYKKIDVSVTLDPIAETQTLVRMTARFDSEGSVVSEGVFANQFFGLLRKEIFLRKYQGSLYQNYNVKK